MGLASYKNRLVGVVTKTLLDTVILQSMDSFEKKLNLCPQELEEGLMLFVGLGW